jgi:hypothetical protein
VVVLVMAPILPSLVRGIHSSGGVTRGVTGPRLSRPGSRAAGTMPV